jgi:hypothetical protein
MNSLDHVLLGVRDLGATVSPLRILMPTPAIAVTSP